ncbi:aromatic ring-hydroxylating oxygenase subunit alpha [Schlesneria paludicola]|uniref:aromatic ring-hydroxylating oxygenase subunit alpha n=1 Tax=Schlesneria paludicola TaxID=360056 RepID=UPI00029AD1DF|nr:SRPBCC family protein [Schlesneria paludicola]
MFHATERLPHILPPQAYWSDAQFHDEIGRLFSRSWHFVGVQSQLSTPGDFITTDVCGQPIQVRNFDGVLHVVSNVCAHRHCLLSGLKSGNSPRLRCQYHGWEYDASGASQRIPLAQHFAPLDRNSVRLPIYRVESVGQLIYVNLDANAPNLSTFLGERYETIRNAFNDGWKVMVSRSFEQQVNWKIPIENSLEAYHVPAIHPETFRVDPGEDRSKHHFVDRGSWFETELPFAPHSKADALFQRVEGALVKLFLGSQPTRRYQQHLVFPNNLFSFTDMVSLLHVVRPRGPRACTSVVYQFGRTGSSYLSRKVCQLWGSMAAQITLSILKEDFQLFPDIQRGLDASQQKGMLGRCEERIHQFQHWLQNQLEQTDSTGQIATSGCPHLG